MTEEEYEKGMMKFKKKELVTHLWKTRKKTKILRCLFNKYKDKQTMAGIIPWMEENYPDELWQGIKTYLGEK